MAKENVDKICQKCGKEVQIIMGGGFCDCTGYPSAG